MAGRDGARVVVVGAGGNIGSHLVPHLARTEGIGRLVLVDRDRYQARNRLNQDLPPRALGRSKAAVQAARARRLNPALRVTAVTEDVETLPLGALRADLILCCVDGRRARQQVNRMAWRLGVPWMDSGVLADGLLARVSSFAPGPASPCLECGWDDADYAALEQLYPCAGNGGAPPPTGAPSGLGALAASLLALEAAKVLAGSEDRLAAGAEVVLAAGHHRHWVTGLRHNPACRLADHAPWPIEPLPAVRRPTLGGLLGLAAAGRPDNGVGLRVDGKRFVRALVCPGCETTRPLLRLSGRLRATDVRCRRCGALRVQAGFGLRERLEARDLSATELARPLAELGLRRGEVVTVGSPGAERHYELGCV